MKTYLLLFGILFSVAAFGQKPMIFVLRAPDVERLPRGAQWMVALADANGNTINRYAFSANSKYQTVELPSQDFGTYTASFYLDLNGNNTLDKGYFGQPKEPYAFSNNAREMFSQPSVSSQRFYFNGDPIRVLLEYHFE